MTKAMDVNSKASSFIVRAMGGAVSLKHEAVASRLLQVATMATKPTGTPVGILSANPPSSSALFNGFKVTVAEDESLTQAWNKFGTSIKKWRGNEQPASRRRA